MEKFLPRGLGKGFGMIFSEWVNELCKICESFLRCVLLLLISLCGGVPSASWSAVPSAPRAQVLVNPTYDEKEEVELAYALWRDGYLPEAQQVLEKSSDRDGVLGLYLKARLEEAQNAGKRTQEFLKQAINLGLFKLMSKERQREVLLFAIEFTARQSQASLCRTYLEQSLQVPQWKPGELVLLLPCVEVQTVPSAAFAMLDQIKALQIQVSELSVSEIRLFKKWHLHEQAYQKALELIQSGRLSAEDELRLAELWVEAPRRAQRLLEVALLQKDSVELREALARLHYDRGNISAARRMFEDLALVEPRFRHLSAELTRSEGRVRSSKIHNIYIQENPIWLRQQIAVGNERKAWSVLSTLAPKLKMLDDNASQATEELRYALAYSVARSGDYLQSTQILQLGSRGPRTEKLQSLLQECAPKLWTCPAKVR